MGWIRNILGKTDDPAATRRQAPAVESAEEPATAEADDPAAAADLAQIVSRWDAGIAAIQRRFAVLLQQAVDGSQPLIEEIEWDMSPLTNPWNAVEARMHEYTEELEEVWEQISDELAELGDALSDEQMDREANKRDVAHTEIEIAHQTAYRGVMAQVGERMRRRALQTDARALRCTQCDAALDKVEPVSQALNVACVYCSAVNTVEPGQSLRMFAASGALFLAEAAALEAWTAMSRAETEMNNYRQSRAVPLTLLERYEASARDYWTTRLTVEAQFNPEASQHVPVKLERYLKDVNKTLRQYWQWRERSIP